MLLEISNKAVLGEAANSKKNDGLKRMHAIRNSLWLQCIRVVKLDRPLFYKQTRVLVSKEAMVLRRSVGT